MATNKSPGFSVRLSIEMPDAPAKQRARARVNRGVAYGQRGQAGDPERAIADYNAVIAIPDVPVERREEALLYRDFLLKTKKLHPKKKRK